jgi:hypothetical protein
MGFKPILPFFVLPCGVVGGGDAGLVEFDDLAVVGVQLMKDD